VAGRTTWQDIRESYASQRGRIGQALLTNWNVSKIEEKDYKNSPIVTKKGGKIEIRESNFQSSSFLGFFPL